MKKITIFLFSALLSAFLSSASAKVISLNPGADVSAALAAASDGDIIELTQSGTYQWLAMIEINTLKSFTIRAKAGLTSRPVIEGGPVVTFGFVFTRNSTVLGNTTQTYDGVVFDGMNRATTFIILKCPIGYNTDVTVNNCVMRGIVNPATPSNITAFTYSNSAPNPNPNNLTITNSVFLYDGYGVVACSGIGRPKNITLTNCFFRGKYTRTIANTSADLVDLYLIDHCTFDGNNQVDVHLWGNVELKNCIFSNSTNTGSPNQNFFGTGGDLKTKCGLYYTVASGTAFASTLYDSGTLRTDPVLDNNGFATASEYVTPGGTDGNPIGFYESNELTTESIKTGLANVSPNVNILTVSQNGSYFRVKGVVEATYSVYSISGCQVATGQIVNESMQLNGLSQGIYLLKTNGQVAKFTVK